VSDGELLRVGTAAGAEAGDSEAPARARERRASVANALEQLESAGYDTASMSAIAAAASGKRGKKGAKSKAAAGSATEAWMGAVKGCVLLDRLSASELSFVLQSARPMQTSVGDVLFKQGDPLVSGMMFLVASGTYRALQQRHGSMARARDYGPLDNFGSSDLLCHDGSGGRTCSVSVLTPGLVWGIPARVVDLKLRIPPPHSVSGIVGFASSLKLFATLSKERVEQLCRGAVVVKLKEGEVACEEGDAAHSIFAVREGSLTTSERASDFSLTISAPATFGEAALGADEELRRRGATVRAGPNGATLVRWQVSSIEALIGFILQEASGELHNRMLLDKVSCGTRLLAEGLTKDEMDALIDCCVEETFENKQVAVAEGTHDSALYIVKSGTGVVLPAGSSSASTTTADRRQSLSGGGGRKGSLRAADSIQTGSKTKELAVLQRGDAFGEVGLLHVDSPSRAKRKMSVVARGDAPLVTLKLTSSAILETESPARAGLAAWHGELLGHIERTASEGLSGVDAVIVQQLRRRGETGKALLATLEKSSAGKGGGSGGGGQSTEGKGKSKQGGAKPKAKPKKPPTNR
jgi:CRP-like cAMP-binding protein